MNSVLYQVASRIRSELRELEMILDRIKEGWKRATQSGDMFYLDGIALNLHGFYSGLERIFELIAVYVDGRKPEGENWHRELLDQMSKNIPKVRPSAISDINRNLLNEYRGFRHVVRNVYSVNFDPLKIERLVKKAPEIYKSVRDELMAFASFLEQAEE